LVIKQGGGYDQDQKCTQKYFEFIEFYKIRSNSFQEVKKGGYEYGNPGKDLKKYS
jgi:hypothetical protein